MKGVRALIKTNLWKAPAFEYYMPIIDKAEKNIIPHPDISIEASKAIIEGICKTIITYFEPTLDRRYFHSKNLDIVLEMAMKHLSSLDNKFEGDFIKRSKGLMHLHGSLRKNRGDISHGQRAPKEEMSSPDYARLIYRISDGIVEYILTSFFRIDFDAEEVPLDEIEVEIKEDKAYSEHTEFNDWLDENNPLDGKLLYSKALFQQDPVAYEAELEEFTGEEEE